MNENGIREAVCEVIGAVLGLGQPVDPGFSREGHAAWDSLKHFEIIFALEDRFNLRFTEAEMEELVSVTKIARRIAELV
jgi:acyl carrier protein